MFSTPAIAVWDVLRIVAGLLAIAAVGMIPFSIVKPGMTWHQRARMGGELGFALAVVGAYLVQLGTLPEQLWRNVVVLLAIGAVAVGHAAFLAQYRTRRSRR